jgi:putative glutamine amidotransferase
VARCPDDGVIEAVELDPSQHLFHVEQSQAAHRGQFVLGVQWHPERSFDISATSRALFARLVAESRAVAGR